MSTLQGSPPLVFQFLERLHKCLALGKDQQRMSRNAVLVKLPYNLAEDPFYFVSSNRIPKPFADNNPDTAWVIVHLVRKQIEYIGGKSPPVALHLLNVPTGPQKYASRALLGHNQYGGWEWQANTHRTLSNTLRTTEA